MAASNTRDDIELGNLEHDAFLPGSNTSKQKAKPNFLLRYLPSKVRIFLENLSRLKLMIILLIAFILLLAWVTLANGKVTIVVPAKSVALAEELVHELSGSSIPEYVLTFAPLVFIDKVDLYYPSDLTTHITNTHPTLNFTTVDGVPDPLTLDNLDKLNDLGGEDIYLTSNSNVIDLPKYLHGQRPSSKTLQTHQAKSCVVVVVEKSNGIVDAFYMYFYTFNAGPAITGHVIGNHLGDWEHNMIRFKNGIPQAVWYSQHEYGQAFSYAAVQKYEQRPIAYSAKGSHANYPKAESHDLHHQNDKVPAHIAFDYTSAGRLWDPTLSAYFYTWSASTKKFTPATDETPVNYLYFRGRWGDPEYGDDKKGQESFHGYHKWTGGPQGPLFKHLDREDVCLPNRPKCEILDSL